MSEPTALKMLRTLHDKLESDALVWDDKNEKLINPVSANNDYCYGYNSGVYEGFRAAANRIEVVIDDLERQLAETGGKR